MPEDIPTYSLDLLKARDTQAWAGLYDALSSDLKAFARRIGSTDPDNIVGETMLNIVRDIDSFNGSTGDIRPWAFRITRHRVIDAARRQKRRPDEVVLNENVHDAISYIDPTGNIDMTQLAHALEQLTMEQRETLWLRYALDFSLETTAEIMGTTPDAVASMAYRALSRLRRNS